MPAVASIAAAAAPDFSGVGTVSQVAVKKAARADAKEFAGLELMEATLLFSLLKELGTPITADIESYAQMALANPDLVEWIRTGADLNEPRKAQFYGGGAEGYTDYPTLAASDALQGRAS